MGFSRQEYWSGLPCPPPGDLPNPRVKPRSPALQADSLPDEPPGKPSFLHSVSEFICWHSSLFDRTHTSLQWDPITCGRQKAPRYSSQMLHRWLEALTLMKFLHCYVLGGDYKWGCENDGPWAPRRIQMPAGSMMADHDLHHHSTHTTGALRSKAHVAEVSRVARHSKIEHTSQ